MLFDNLKELWETQDTLCVVSFSMLYSRERHFAGLGRERRRRRPRIRYSTIGMTHTRRLCARALTSFEIVQGAVAGRTRRRRETAGTAN